MFETSKTNFSDKSQNSDYLGRIMTESMKEICGVLEVFYF